jgi:hypothetical protein
MIRHMIPLRVELRSQESEPWVITTLHYGIGFLLKFVHFLTSAPCNAQRLSPNAAATEDPSKHTKNGYYKAE